MQLICDKHLCSGCCACYNKCPRAAITMQEDEFGFFHPLIDQNKCIDCGLCVKVCPENFAPQFNKEIVTYASISKNEEIRCNSTSGGVATTLSQIIIDNSGVVYGAAFDGEFNLSHTRIVDKKDLPKLQGSKYVQSYIGETYKHVKNDLSFHPVLFIGTPCQVAGLLNYIPEKFKNNLFSISFICGGVPSAKFLKNSLSDNLNNAVGLKFRNGKDYGFWIRYKNGYIKYIKRDSSRYFRGFDKKITLRYSCYNCRFAQNARVGDLTIGDFWGLSHGRFLNNKQKGISIIICSTKKGKYLVEKSSGYLELENHDLCETLIMNPRLSSPPEWTKDIDRFRRYFLKSNSFNTAINRIMGHIYVIYAIKKLSLIHISEPTRPY